MLGRIARSLLALVGALAVVVGAAAAVYIGPDDDLLLPSSRPDAAPGQLVVTAGDLLSYDDLTLVVRARAEGGVLLAAGNPVDVSSLAGQVEHWEVTGVRPGGVVGGTRPASARDPVPLGDLSVADLWTSHSEGEGWQELRLRLNGQPVQLLAQPSTDAVPELQVGLHVAGLFWLLVAVAGTGALLLGLAVTLMVRRQRAPGRAATLLVPMVALALAATGCGVPHHVDSAPASRVALDQSDLEAMLAAYDEKNNRAIRAAAAPRYDAGPWREVDTGPVLQDDIYTTIVARRSHEQERAHTYTHTPVAAYSTHFATYPLWSLVVTGDEDAAEIDVFTQATAASPWLMRTTSDVDLDDLPDAAEDGNTSSVDASVEHAARSAISATSRYVATGIRRDIQVTAAVRAIHERATHVPAQGRRFIDSAAATVDSAAADPQDDLRLVAVEGGHLAVAVRPMRVTYYPRTGMDVFWNPPVKTVNGAFGEALYQEFNLCLTVFVPSDGGTPRAIAASALLRPA
ncbi:hypothetical protein [Nocardioides sp.]|uniref:hypothetical protein n=1 Tax=Nocardioides sp. TaxID=35761 RepID=UPI0025F71F11|nr:hypothetical protein [Nocardioides sp.]